MKRMQAFSIILIFISLATSAAQTQWINTGPDLGNVGCLLLSPDTPGKIYGGTEAAKLYVSTDYGASWNTASQIRRTDNTPATEIRTLCFSGQNLFAATFGDTIFRSGDGGVTWKSASNGLKLAQIFTIAESGGAIVAGTALPVMGHNGVYVSTDNGDNWTARPGFTDFDIRSLIFNGGRLFAGTAGDAVFASDDLGVSWKKAGYGMTDSTVYALARHGADLLAATQVKGVAILTNSVDNWKEASLGMSKPGIRSLAVWGQNIFAGSYGGGVYLSTDNGAWWQELNTGLTNLYIRSLVVVPGSPAYLCAGTDGGGVFRRSLADVTGIEASPDPTAQTLSLEQNHPNPVSHSTTISFFLPEAGTARLSITTMFGTEITTLVSDRLEAGFHEAHWNAGSLPNGAYLCRLQQGSFSETRIVTVAR
jgi:hypothetical protein